MNERALAKFGALQLRFEELDEAYTSLLHVLAGVVRGEIEAARVLVNLTERSWQVAPPLMRPPTPQTLNGLPDVAVAPDTFGEQQNRVRAEFEKVRAEAAHANGAEDRYADHDEGKE